MAIAATLTTLEGVPAELAEHYEQSESGEYVLRVDGYEGDIGLRATLDGKKRDIQKLRDKLKAYADIDPDEIAELREMRDTYEERIAQAGKWEDQKTRLEAKYEKEMQALRTQLQQETDDHHTFRKRAQVLTALSEAGANPDALDEKVLQRVRINRDDDGYSLVATGLDGETDTDIAGLIAEMKASGRFDWGFAPNGNSGTGGAAGGGGGSANHGVRSKADLKGTAEHSAYIAAHGLAAYQELPRE